MDVQLILFRVGSFSTYILVPPFLPVLEASHKLRFLNHQQLLHCSRCIYFHMTKSFVFQSFVSLGNKSGHREPYFVSREADWLVKYCVKVKLIAQSGMSGQVHCHHEFPTFINIYSTYIMETACKWKFCLYSYLVEYIYGAQHPHNWGEQSASLTLILLHTQHSFFHCGKEKCFYCDDWCLVLSYNHLSSPFTISFKILFICFCTFK